jgi:hypothetical protein
MSSRSSGDPYLEMKYQEFRLIAVLFGGFDDEVLEVEALLVDFLHFLQCGDDQLIIFGTPFLRYHYPYQEALLYFIVWGWALLEVNLEVCKFIRKFLVESLEEAKEGVLVNLHRILIENF